jgi:PHS family inorganic phosphate transporter-like MFS transporter
VRGTAHGLSAASGKCGAVLTSFAFGTLNDTLGLRGALGLFAGVMVLVALFSLWIPETRGKTLEEIEKGVLYGDALEEEGSTRSVAKPSEGKAV